MTQNNEFNKLLGKEESNVPSVPKIQLPNVAKTLIVFTTTLLLCLSFNLYIGYLLDIPEDLGVLGLLKSYWYIYIPNIFAAGYASNLTDRWKS